MAATMAADTGARACPSYQAGPEASLLGVVNDEGTVDILPRPIPLSPAFLDEAAQKGEPLEQRFRFTGPCINERCQQWRDGGCRIGRMVAVISEDMRPLSPCAIRGSCRWFAQEGARACHGCAYVVTDGREG